MNLAYCVSSCGISYLALYNKGEVLSIGIPPSGSFVPNQKFVFLFSFDHFLNEVTSSIQWLESPDISNTYEYSDIITKFASPMCRAVGRTYGGLVGPPNNPQFINEKQDVVSEYCTLRSLIERIV